MADINELLKLKHTLRFHADGEFKIMFLSDLHTKPAKKSMDIVLRNIRALVDMENPDLVILGGDTTQMCETLDQVRELLSLIVGYIEEKRIPWAHVYGNHDDELYPHMTMVPSKEELQRLYESFEYCVSKDVRPLYGVGTCLLPVLGSRNDEIAFNVWCVDSNTYLSEEEMKRYGVSCAYDFIRQDQIDWYTGTSSFLEEYYGRKISGVMTFHVPLPEHDMAWEQREQYTGLRNEPVCNAHVNSGLFDAVLQRGDVRAIVCGHDHTNDFAVNHKGILLCCAGMASVENTHIVERLGARVVAAREADPATVATYMAYINTPSLSETIESV